jgi:mRNA-degrading endonuclease RelE of RelBE toxin-antitoxin system
MNGLSKKTENLDKGDECAGNQYESSLVGLRSLRVGNRLRAVYEMDREDQAVTVLVIREREDDHVYQIADARVSGRRLWPLN